MSRTDVHAPYYVKQRDPGWRDHFAEWHDHSQGPCDLDQFLASRHWIRTRCYVEPRWRGQQIHCGCDLCTGQTSRKLKRRLERRTAKQALRSGDWEAAMLTRAGEPYWYYQGPTTWKAYQAQDQDS